jgi:hypothetical protein
MKEGWLNAALDEEIDLPDWVRLFPQVRVSLSREYSHE